MTLAMAGTRANTWIFQTAKADSALMANLPGGVFQGMADVNVAGTPFMTYQQMSGTDTMNGQAVRFYSVQLWKLEIWGVASQSTMMNAAADQMDSDFGLDREVDMGSYIILACYREQDIDMLEADGSTGIKYRRVGGIYRIYVQVK